MNEQFLNKSLLGFIDFWTMLAGAFLILITVVTSVNAGAFGLDKVARMFGENVSALPGYEDFVRLVISGGALMFFPYCQIKKGHVQIDLMEPYLSKKTNIFLDLLGSTVLFLCVAFLFYWMNLGLLETRADGALSRVLSWDEWYFYIPGIISLFLWLAVLFAQMRFDWQELRKSQTSTGATP